jgi:hypothetical protein
MFTWYNSESRVWRQLLLVEAWEMEELPFLEIVA